MFDIKIFSEAKKYLYRLDNLSKYKTCMDIDGFLKRAKSLLVVVSTPPTVGYEEFTDKVRHYNTLPPFVFSTPSFPNKTFVKFVSIYAAYLYDAVKLYANALDELLRNETRELTDEIILNHASNGSAIIDTMKEFKSYKSKFFPLFSVTGTLEITSRQH
jgi:guanylate cyclase, other